MNLMLNAIETMKDSGAELRVKSEAQAGQIQFSVRDTGVELPMENMDQMFSVLFTTKPQGSGMGLAISRTNPKRAGSLIRRGAREPCASGLACKQYLIDDAKLTDEEVADAADTFSQFLQCAVTVNQRIG